ncbi:MAG: hypothetical protein JJ902_03960 [Roseibium sp.]|nr:hypothetical protein [Roseibium sp.]
MATYMFILRINGAEFSSEGHKTLLDAKVSCYRMAFEYRAWRPAKLREAWWQFWRPAEHNVIEKIILSEAESEGAKC